MLHKPNYSTTHNRVLARMLPSQGKFGIEPVEKGIDRCSPEIPDPGPVKNYD